MSAIIVFFEDGKWQITTGSKVLDTAPNWTSAIDVARSWLGKLNNSMTTDCDVIELHKKNGTVQIFGGDINGKYKGRRDTLINAIVAA